VDADAVIQRRTTGFPVLFVQGNHGLTGFGHGMQQICAGRRLTEVATLSKLNLARRILAHVSQAISHDTPSADLQTE
jgi:hypothetical protein